MALTDPVLPYGLRDIKLTPINADGSLGTPVDLPVARTLTFSEAEEFEELRGDDHLVAIHGRGAQVEWELEAGGISIDAWKVLSGGTIDESGSTPNQVKTYTKKFSHSRPYFQIEGQSIADDGGDVHVVIKKAKCDSSLEGEFADGTFFLTSGSGTGLADDNDDLYVITWNETETAISSTNNEVQEVIVDATGGTFTLTYDGQTTAALAYNISAADLETALEALSNVDPGDVSVTGSAGGPFRVEFTGNLAGTDVDQMIADSTSLTGASAAAVVRTVKSGG